MGDLELKAREFAPLIIFERKDDASSLESIAREVSSDIERALKEVRESLETVVAKEVKDDLRQVVEQDIDPEAYDSTDYSASVSYGSTTHQVAYTYKGLSHDGKEANSASYDVNVSMVEETKLHGRLQEVHEAARDANQLGRVEVTDLDPVKRNAKQEMAMRHGPTFSFLQYALLGKVDFL